jgi:copper chaperone
LLGGLRLLGQYWRKKSMKIVLDVKGMKCGGCENSVREAVQGLPGVTGVQPSFRENQVEIEYDEGQADLSAIRAAIAAKGYQVG